MIFSRRQKLETGGLLDWLQEEGGGLKRNLERHVKGSSLERVLIVEWPYRRNGFDERGGWWSGLSVLG